MFVSFLRIINILLFSVLCIWHPLCAAHEFWVEPSTFRAVPGKPVDLNIYVGKFFFGDPQVYLPRRIVQFKVQGPQGNVSIESEFGEEPVGIFTPMTDGAHVVTYQGTPINIETKPYAFNNYLKSSGLDHVIEQRASKRQTHESAREQYTRFAKSFVTVGKSGVQQALTMPTGLHFELTPVSDPNALRTGDTLSLRVDFEQKALRDILVVAFPIVDAQRMVSVRSGEDGIAKLPITHPGAWLFSAVHMVPGNGDRFDWESFWSSLTLEIDKEN